MIKFQYITLILVAGMLFACSPKVKNDGFVTDESIKSQVVIGQTTKDQLREKLGSPSAQSTFGDDAWYYIKERQEAWGFFKPRVVAQDTTRITFDKNGVVSKVEDYNLKDSQDVAMVSRVTPTEGHTLGFFEQVLGNIGRFNAPSNNSAAPGRQPSGGSY